MHGVVTFYRDFRTDAAGPHARCGSAAPRRARRSARTRSPSTRSERSASTFGETTRRRRGHARPGVLPRQLRARPVGRRSTARCTAGSTPTAFDAAASTRARPMTADPTVTVYVPRDAAARRSAPTRSPTAIAAGRARAGRDVRVVRNGSRGMLWLEPLVEVATDRRPRRATDRSRPATSTSWSPPASSTAPTTRSRLGARRRDRRGCSASSGSRSPASA